MKKQFVIAVVPLLMLILTGCGMKESKAEAEKLGNSVFDRIMAKDYEKTADLYSEEFYSAVTREKWISMLVDVNVKLGDLKGYKLSSWKASRKLGFGGGTYILLLYKTQYERGEAEETLTMSRLSGGELQIKAHNISSKELMDTQT